MFMTLKMGLTSVVAMRQRVMPQVLQRLHGQNYLVYLDKEIVFGGQRRSSCYPIYHWSYNNANNPTKCVSLQTSLSFPGHIVPAEGLVTDLKKVQAVTEWLTPAPKDET